MALGTLTLLTDTNTGSARQAPETDGAFLVETWQYSNADATRTNDLITCKKINRIHHAKGVNQDNYGATNPYTIDNTVFPPTLALAGVTTGEGGIITIYGY